MRSTKTVLTLALVLAAMPVMAQTVYRWVDEQGVTHFSSTPPEGMQAEELHLRAPPGLDGEPEQELELAVEPEPGSEPSIAEIRARNCATARNNLAQLETAEVALRTDPETGEQIEIRGAALQAAIAQTLEQIREFCLESPGD